MEVVRIGLGIAGIGILLFVIADVLWTTLRLAGAGPLTSWVTNLLWRGSLRVFRSHKRLALAGFYVVLFTVVMWIGLAWLGWTLVLGMDERSVVDTQTGEPGDFWARVYYAGFTLITLGNGDFRPGGPIWQVATPIAAANGFFLLTLVITYLLPLMSAALQRREAALAIMQLGRTPQEVVLNAWTGSGFGRLPDYLLTLTLPLAAVSEGHLAYPVLHCFHSSERDTAIAPNIAVLDEALHILEHVAPEHRLDPTVTRPLRGAIQRLLSTLSEAHLKPERNPPPPPDLGPLRQAGIPFADDAAFQQALTAAVERRRLVFGLVEKEGWHWDDVTGVRKS